uniref:KN17 SH3-like domain-containing protein n=1 Tax=Ananas comosus var. bracteatus TaxID=296719 RepID=A0A6V7NJU1_ANACO|nr:unnamed protein product [Ananas comosus var. bracteatus]
MSKTLAEKGYYKQKGVVKRVVDKYVGEIEMLESKHVLRVDQEELETVIPQIGGFFLKILRILSNPERKERVLLSSDASGVLTDAFSLTEATMNHQYEKLSDCNYLMIRV